MDNVKVLVGLLVAASIYSAQNAKSFAERLSRDEAIEMIKVLSLDNIKPALFAGLGTICGKTGKNERGNVAT